MAMSTSWPGSVMCLGSLWCPYSTAGTRPARLIWRAGPLPNSVRGSAMIFTSGTVALLELTEKSLQSIPGRCSRLSTRPFSHGGLLALAVEQAGDRPVAEDLVDGARDQGRNRQHGELVEPLVVRDRQRVRHDHLADPRVLEHVDRAAGEDAVRRGDDDLLCALVEQRVSRLHDRLPGVDHVVNDDAGATLYLADHLEDARLIGHIGVAPLVDDRQRAAEPVGPPLADPDP